MKKTPFPITDLLKTAIVTILYILTLIGLTITVFIIATILFVTIYRITPH